MVSSTGKPEVDDESGHHFPWTSAGKTACQPPPSRWLCHMAGGGVDMLIKKGDISRTKDADSTLCRCLLRIASVHANMHIATA